jgi:hypothetical protein
MRRQLRLPPVGYANAEKAADLIKASRIRQTLLAEYNIKNSRDLFDLAFLTHSKSASTSA